MIRIGLRDSVLLLTLVPTVIIGLVLGGYFTLNRYLELDENLLNQGSTIIEPLAVALEQPLKMKQKETLNRLLSHSHNKHSPLIKSIAIFDANKQLLLTSNYHRTFHELEKNLPKNDIRTTVIRNSRNFITLYAPIWDHEGITGSALNNIPMPAIGFLAIQLNREQAVVGQQKAVLISGVIIILALVFALVLAIRLSKLFTKPLSKLVLATDKLSEGKRDTGLDKEMIGEFELLRQGLNMIALNMELQKEEMQKHIDQATSDYRETLEQYETQNIQLNIAKKEAQDANRVKSDFLAKMSHELRTPLNGVIGFTRQLFKTPLNKNQKDYLDTIELSANSLLAIISDILDFSKLEAGAMELENIQFELRDAVNEVLTLLAPSAHDKNLELSVSISPQVPDHLMGDPTRFKQVLSNLVSNAIKFTEQGSVTIDISSRLLDDRRCSLLISVKDTGVGIATDKQDTLFTPFGQADSSITRRFGGTGLGLIITKHLVEAMHGRITLNSALGKGTCFTFNAVHALPEHPYSEDLPSQSLEHKRMLYLEPHEHTHMATLSLLKQWRLQVTACKTEDQFKQALLTGSKYDICLIGHHAEVDELKNLKEYIQAVRPRTDYLYLMLNTVSHNMREALVGSGADACLSKPLNHRKLCEVLAAPYRLDHPAVGDSTSETRQLPLKALVVDDNDANLKLIHALLEEQVEAVDTAHNGAQAVSLCKRHKYDLVFMDIQMPIMDGITACKVIQESSLNEDTPIIAVTAHALAGEKEDLLKVGFTSYLTKPLDEDMLSQAISNYSPQYTQMQRKTSQNQELPPPFESSRLDWKVALQRAGGKNELANEMLNMLLLSIPETLSLLDNAMQNQDMEHLLSIMHKFHGACCYTGVPKLKKLAETLETALKKKTPLKDIEPELFEIQDEMTNLLADAGITEISTDQPVN